MHCVPMFIFDARRMLSAPLPMRDPILIEIAKLKEMKKIQKLQFDVKVFLLLFCFVYLFFFLNDR